MSDLPIVMLNDEAADQPRDCWALCAHFIQRMLQGIGFAALVIALFIGAGYWWGKWEIRLHAERVKAEIQRQMQPDCGSCRLEKRK
jgi:hypothetical protein